MYHAHVQAVSHHFGPEEANELAQQFIAERLPLPWITTMVLRRALLPEKREESGEWRLPFMRMACTLLDSDCQGSDRS